MVERRRARPGGTSIPAVIDDVADATVAGPFRLIYPVFNALVNLLNQARQVDCFRNVAKVLEPGVYSSSSASSGT